MVLTSLIIILISSLIIYYAGEEFSTASSWIGEYLGMSKSAKGATLDAISSSMPELSIALFSLIIFYKFEIGVGTVVGSALFNILIIPAICVLVAPMAFKINEEVIHRDGLFYILTVIVLLTVIFYRVDWSIYVGLVLVATYLFYSFEIFRHGSTSKYKKRLFSFFRKGPSHEPKSRKKKKLFHEVVIFFVTLFLIIISSYFLVDYSIQLANFLGIPAIIIAFTVTAAATSSSDLVVSVADSRKGDMSGATSNIFGSNIFDILIGLGLPIIIASFLGISIDISIISMSILFGLLASTIVTLYILAERMTLTKPRAAILVLIYISLVAIVVVIA